VRAAPLPALALAFATVAGAGPPPQEVRIHLVLSRPPHGTAEERDRIRLMEEDLLGLLESRGAGSLGRDAWPEGACIITLETPDARLAWAVVEPAVRAFGPRPGSYVVLRQGPEGAAEERIPLEPPTPPR